MRSEVSWALPVETGREIRYAIDIDADVGRENDETILVLRFAMAYQDTARPGRLRSVMHYPLGAAGREALRRVLNRPDSAAG